jgi:hypothetical protein
VLKHILTYIFSLFIYQIGEEIRKKFENEETIKVTVLKAMGEEAILSYKVENDK